MAPVLLSLAAAAFGQGLGREADGAFVLPTGWKIAPAGTQIPLNDTLPINIVARGQNLFILNTGYLPPGLVILNTAAPSKLERVGLEDAWLGLAVNKAGNRLYIPEGNLGTVREFSYLNGKAAPLRQFHLFPLADPTKKGTDRLSKTDFLGDAALSKNEKTLYVANMQADLVYFIDLAAPQNVRKFPVGRHPYRL
ncbi:MAG TPA: hypothetical protein VGP94_05465, partial [Tepidisphaeraceae bacterium]|nr:hypothetical protein [Tepidisphaeraceae bacterium]